MGAFPNQLLTVVIWNDVWKTFEKAPEELFKDKEVCVTGRIELFRESVLVVVKEKEMEMGQLTLGNRQLIIINN